MPELPEVENFCRSLTKRYSGKKVSRVIFRRDGIRKPIDAESVRRIFRNGSIFLAAKRDGKRLIIGTNHGEILVSLGMSGAFLPTDPQKPLLHEHLTFIFSDGEALGYVDPRRFGHIEPRTGPLPHRADALDRKSLLILFDSEKIRKSGRQIKELLMDQHLIGGIGNIYALEALHASGIRPTRKVRSLSANERKKLADTIPGIMRSAILHGGSTVATYRTLHGTKGDFQKFHRVYAREESPCLTKGCRGIIKRIVKNNRSAYYCPNCQR
jgi:formamidopyrimidine-DNA glycosylase